MKKATVTVSVLFFVGLFSLILGQNYVGTYGLTLSGQSTGMTATIQKSGTQYNFTLKKSGQNDVSVLMEDTGQGLFGKDDSGIICAVGNYENQLVFQFGALATFVLVRSNDTQQNTYNESPTKSTSKSGQIDQRLVGTWRYKNTKSSSTGPGHTFSRNITFLSDGTCAEGTGYVDYESSATGNSRGNRKTYYVQGNQVVVGNQTYYYSIDQVPNWGLVLGLRTNLNEKEMLFVKQ